MSPEEGFLLSRIDGNTPWTLLRQIGGLPPEEVDRCLERWMDVGILEIPGAERASKSKQAPPKAQESSQAKSRANGRTSKKPLSEVGDEPLDPALEQWVDTGLDLSEALQRRILALEADLERPYHELLGVAWDADTKAIKRAYFKLSKDFHPDRYFRRQIGDYKPRLEKVFKKLVEAYELLSDPATREEIQKSLPPDVFHSAPEPEPEVGETVDPVVLQQRRRREMLERVRRQFRIPERILVERRHKARNFYDASRVAAARQRWLEAAASARLAIAFDPAELEYKKGFAEIQMEVHRARADELREKAAAAMEEKAHHEALRLWEEVLHYQPGDTDAHICASRVALEANEGNKALELAEQACELEPDRTEPLVALARVWRRKGDRDQARAALERALELDPRDRPAREELSDLRRQARRRKGGTA